MQLLEFLRRRSLAQPARRALSFLFPAMLPQSNLPEPDPTGCRIEGMQPSAHSDQALIAGLGLEFAQHLRDYFVGSQCSANTTCQSTSLAAGSLADCEKLFRVPLSIPIRVH